MGFFWVIKHLNGIKNPKSWMKDEVVESLGTSRKRRVPSLQMLPFLSLLFFGVPQILHLYIYRYIWIFIWSLLVSPFSVIIYSLILSQLCPAWHFPISTVSKYTSLIYTPRIKIKIKIAAEKDRLCVGLSEVMGFGWNCGQEVQRQGQFCEWSRTLLGDGPWHVVA